LAYLFYLQLQWLTNLYLENANDDLQLGMHL